MFYCRINILKLLFEHTKKKTTASADNKNQFFINFRVGTSHNTNCRKNTYNVGRTDYTIDKTISFHRSFTLRSLRVFVATMSRNYFCLLNFNVMNNGTQTRCIYIYIGKIENNKGVFLFVFCFVWNAFHKNYIFYFLSIDFNCIFFSIRYMWNGIAFFFVSQQCRNM